MPDPSAILEADRLTKDYGRLTAIRDVSFTVGRGEAVGFLGPNGAGKSTTMRILCGLVRATSGQAWVGGHPVASEPRAARRLIGYMPENNPLPEDLRVDEYLHLRARLKEIEGRRRRRRVEEVLELCDLRRKARRRLIGTLSKGFRQRVGVADALLAEPAVAILDEPTIGLDPHQILLFRELLGRLRGVVTVILSSHILAEVELSCDRVMILNQGRIVASGTRDSLRAEFLPERRFRVEAATDAAGFAAALAAAVPGGRADGGDPGVGRHEFTAPADADPLPPLLARLVGDGIAVRGAHPVVPSLEEVFLAATRRRWAEAGAVVAAGPGSTPGPFPEPPAAR